MCQLPSIWGGSDGGQWLAKTAGLLQVRLSISKILADVNPQFPGRSKKRFRLICTLLAADRHDLH
jgi:hypothetical protein